MVIGKYHVKLIGFGGTLFYWSDMKFNSGWPYSSWRFGPILVKRYWR